MMSINCEFKKLASQPTLSIRLKTAAQDLPQVFGKGYGEIAEYLGELQEEPDGPPFAIYYNMDMQNLDLEFGFPVSPNLKGRGGIHKSETPSGECASCFHVGPYSEVESAYNALFQWIKENGYEATGVTYEVYLNDPDETPPDKLETQIFLLIKTAQ